MDLVRQTGWFCFSTFSWVLAGDEQFARHFYLYYELGATDVCISWPNPTPLDPQQTHCPQLVAFPPGATTNDIITQYTAVFRAHFGTPTFLTYITPVNVANGPPLLRDLLTLHRNTVDAMTHSSPLKVRQVGAMTRVDQMPQPIKMLCVAPPNVPTIVYLQPMELYRGIEQADENRLTGERTMLGLRTGWGRRQQSTEQSEYPNLAADIIGNSLRSAAKWGSHFIGAYITYVPYNLWAMIKGTYQWWPLPQDAAVPIGPQHGVYPLANNATLAIAADWAAGTRESQAVANVMAGGAPEAARHSVGNPLVAGLPDWTIHLGDVYYVGTESEVRTNCLGEQLNQNGPRGVWWPIGKLGSLVTAGNHEMYSHGRGLYRAWLPRLGMRSQGLPFDMTGQKAPYFAMVSQHWIIVALDTGYACLNWWCQDKEPDLKDPVLRWLTTLMAASGNDKKGVLLMTHHTPVSAFSANPNPMYKLPRQLEKVLNRRTVVWLFGHEHRLAIYGKQTLTGCNYEVYPRCVGQSGYPAEIHQSVLHRTVTSLLYFDDRVDRSNTMAQHCLMGYNGWVTITIGEGNSMSIDYCTVNGANPPAPTRLYSERFTAGNGQAVQGRNPFAHDSLTVCR